MSHANGIINANSQVELIGDIMAVLALNDTRISAACRAADLAEWSKRKPIRDDRPFLDRSGEWWKGTNGKCGFRIRTSTLITQLFNETYYDWLYLKPNGTPYWYRWLDFQGYWHGATSPIGGFTIPSQIGQNVAISNKGLIRAPQPEDTTYQLTLSDISVEGYPIQGNVRFGIAWRAEGASTCSTAYAMIGDPFAQVLSFIPSRIIKGSSVTHHPVGTVVEVMPFWEIFPNGALQGEGIYMRIPGIQNQKCTIITAGSSGDSVHTFVTAKVAPVYDFTTGGIAGGTLTITVRIDGDTVCSQNYVRVYGVNGSSSTLLHTEDFGRTMPGSAGWSRTIRLGASKAYATFRVEYYVTASSGPINKSVLAIMPAGWTD